MNILIVGAGAVGVSYGWALQKGGARVSFLVKSKYADEIADGINVYPLKRRNHRQPVRFSGFGVLTSPEEVRAAGGWDQVWLCVSSPALRGSWLPELLGVLGPETILVVLQPGSEDLELVRGLWASERVVAGMITLVAYQTPLPGENDHPPGIAVWLPPLAALPLMGPADAARSVADALKRGGWRAKVKSSDARPGGAVASGALLPHVAAMEGAGWTIDGLNADGWGDVAAKASREAMVVIGTLRGSGAPWLRAAIRPWTMRTFLKIGRLAAPFDFEVYFAKHFTKVRDQTEQSLDTWISAAERLGLPAVHMQKLRRRVFG